jgi:hypothetical protein
VLSGAVAKRDLNVRLSPDSDQIADIAGGPVGARLGHGTASFDHLVSLSEQFFGYAKTERLGGLQVDH